MQPPYLDLMRPRPTGNVLLSLDPRMDHQEQLACVEECAHALSLPGRTMAFTAATVGSVKMTAREQPVLLPEISVAILQPPRLQSAAASAAQLSQKAGILEARPEFYMFAAPFDGERSVDTQASTWGLERVGAPLSAFTGAGIRIAVLDTGFDAGHPDFFGRPLTRKSFVADGSVDDIRGHGTHCVGTALGPAGTSGRPRYGVAPDAEIYVGKVLDDAGVGAEGDILAGIAWAIETRCHVISLSLGRPVRIGETPSLVYERLARHALEAGSLIVAAAGNDSSRAFGYIAPVSEPANAPSILAVGALTPDDTIAAFSCGGINPQGGEVDLVAPGEMIFSAFPMPRGYNSLSGTSMACPHVAGVAALWAQSDPSLRGRRLWDALLASAQSLALSRRDIGAGVVQAPV
ncbi:S8 family serine peptidase [Segnochrobactraceae bacterium EtOH-i3]